LDLLKDIKYSVDQVMRGLNDITLERYLSKVSSDFGFPIVALLILALTSSDITFPVFKSRNL
jgi:hypothetical protein